MRCRRVAALAKTCKVKALGSANGDERVLRKRAAQGDAAAQFKMGHTRFEIRLLSLAIEETMSGTPGLLRGWHG